VKPIAILRHCETEGPGYFATWLERRGAPWRLVAVDAGDAVPRDARAFSGLVFMGGPMSVNDPLPWIEAEIALIRDAVAKDVPVLGHCLGGQLIARALGGEVRRNRVKEIGWGEVAVEDNSVARAWLGDTTRFDAFHWHGETFTIPFGATRILSGAHCTNQGFAVGRHLGLQCHVEMTEEMVRRWVADGARDLARARSPAVQPAAEILRRLPARLEALQRVADRLYERWYEGVERSA